MNDPQAIAADAANFRQAVLAGQPYKPLYVKLKVIWACNLRCGMCNHWRDPGETPLDLDFFLPVIDDLAELGCQKLHLTGGEPTLRPNLEALIAHATERGIRVTMTTNGTRIDAQRAYTLVSAGLRKVNLSIDSPNPTIHDRIRGLPGAWERATAGFRHLRPWLNPGRMRINTVVGQLNYASLVHLPDLAVSLGADRLNLIPLDPNTPDLLPLKRWQIWDYNWRIATVLAPKAMAAGLLEQPADAYPFGKTISRLGQSSAGEYAGGYYHQHRCYAPWTHALIDHVGRVSLCCMMPNQPTIGDLRQQSFKQIWTGEAYTALRQTTQRPQFAACHRCDMFLKQNQQIEALL